MYSDDGWLSSYDAWKTRSPEDSDPHFNDEEPDDDVVEATNLECGCVEYSNGDKDMCETHDAEFMATALGGEREVVA